MAKRTKKLFAEIAKSEAQDDGTIKVWGYASTGAEDSDKETVTSDAMKAALPDYMKFGAVREMHDATKAAGTAIEASVDADGKTWFGAHVVDPVAVKKVQTGVYKGFSIGGKVTERDELNKSIIKGLRLTEVSLVDRPANPEAVITLMKADGTTPEEAVEELAEILDAGGLSAATLLDLAKQAQALGPDAIIKVEAAEVPADEGTAEAPTRSTVALGEVRKGMYSVGRFAELLQSLAYLCSDAECEAEYEEDGSQVPAALKDWIAQGATVFGAMASEEVAELIAALAKAKDAGDLRKVNKSKPAEAEAPKLEDLIAKALAPINGELDTLRKAHADLQAKHEEILKRPAPGKALLKAVAVAKGADNNPADEAIAKVEGDDSTAPKEGTEERAMYELRKVLGGGGMRLVG